MWHMLYRFASEETLEAWERSPERSWWLSMGEGFVRSERSRRRTGIEGWFDEPATGSVPVADAAASGGGDADLPPAPPRWKQAVTIWLGFFPVNLLFAYLVAPVPGLGRPADLAARARDDARADADHDVLGAAVRHPDAATLARARAAGRVAAQPRIEPASRGSIGRRRRLLDRRLSGCRGCAVRASPPPRARPRPPARAARAPHRRGT